MSESTSPLRVGLVGYGLAGAVFHAPLIASTPDLRLHSVVTSDPARRARLAGDHPDARAVGSVDELLADPSQLDLVVVASPNSSHVPVARASLEAGLPVVVDKPLAAIAAEARDLAALAAQRGLLLTVFQNRRWDSDFLTAKQLIADGALGTVHRYESRFERWRPALREGWRESPDPVEAGGLLYDLGSHIVDQALHLFGPAERVYAELNKRRAGTAVDDDVFVALTHVSGVRSHLWMSAVATQFGPRLRVLGDRAAYTVYGLDPQEDALSAGQRPGPGWGTPAESSWGLLGTPDAAKPHPSLPGDYPAFYEAVATAVRKGSAPPVTPDGVIATLTVLEAARRSATEGRTVSLSPAEDGVSA
jgi:scyllo-inositol 2-dehydrogenase (NADP+)